MADQPVDVMEEEPAHIAMCVRATWIACSSVSVQQNVRAMTAVAGNFMNAHREDLLENSRLM